MNPSVEVGMVTKEGCLPCLRIKRILGELKVELPEIQVREVDFASEEGVALAVKNSILYPPAVFINGTLFAKGKIMEEPLKEAVRKAARGE
ncbi:MAG: glutaredoxin [Nitrososphaerales archaeon]|nr:glutaredoxin [Nitrososphaerales archaeon]